MKFKSNIIPKCQNGTSTKTGNARRSVEDRLEQVKELLSSGEPFVYAMPRRYSKNEITGRLGSERVIYDGQDLDYISRNIDHGDTVWLLPAHTMLKSRNGKLSLTWMGPYGDTDASDFPEYVNGSKRMADSLYNIKTKIPLYSDDDKEYMFYRINCNSLHK